MDMEKIARKIGVGVVMIVPTFVGGGAAWDMTHSWLAVILWIAVMAAATGWILARKFDNPADLAFESPHGENRGPQGQADQATGAGNPAN